MGIHTAPLVAQSGVASAEKHWATAVRAKYNRSWNIYASSSTFALTVTRLYAIRICNAVQESGAQASHDERCAEYMGSSERHQAAILEMLNLDDGDRGDGGRFGGGEGEQLERWERETQVGSV